MVAALIAQHPGNQPHHGLSDHEHRHFPTDEHIVADGHLPHPVALRRILDDPLVDALVTAASKHNVGLLGPGLRIRLGERSAGGRGHQQQRQIRGIVHLADVGASITVRRGRIQLFPGSSTQGNIIQRGTPHRGFHHHAGATTAGSIVHRLMRILRPIPQVMHANRQDALLQRLP